MTLELFIYIIAGLYTFVVSLRFLESERKKHRDPVPRLVIVGAAICSGVCALIMLPVILLIQLYIFTNRNLGREILKLYTKIAG